MATVARPERCREAGYHRPQPLGQRDDLAALGEGDILLAEVELQLDECHKVEQLLAQAAQLAAVGTAHLVHGHAVGGGRLRGDDIGHRLGLGEVDTARGEGTAGEFARLGHAAAGLDEGGEELLLNPPRAVAREFDHVLAGERARATVEGEHYLVEQLAVAVGDAAQMGGVRGHVAQGFALPAMAHNVDGSRAAHAHHGNATHARRCGDGADGVGVGMVDDARHNRR